MRVTVKATLAVFLLAGSSVTGAPSAAQSYPTKPIRLIVPFTAGSPVDAAARVLTQHLQARLGQSVVIENRPGAGTTIGTKAAAAATPDGYTLLFVGDNLAYYSTLYPKLDFDPLKSLTPVASAVAWSHVMVVAPGVPVKTIGELIAYAKANPGKIVFGFSPGTAPHVLGETFKQAAGGIDINFVPYRGGEQARVDLLGGRVHLNLAPVGNLASLIQDGKVRPLAFTGPKRSPNLPDVPTMTESGFPQVGFNPDSWHGFLGPAKMANPTVSKLNTEINESLKSPDVNAAFGKLAFEPKVTTPQEFSAFLTSQMKTLPPILRAAGLKPE
jgi:tripartite-type tricarboxylate transporter receptor subunit TctC